MNEDVYTMNEQQLNDYYSGIQACDDKVVEDCMNPIQDQLEKQYLSNISSLLLRWLNIQADRDGVQEMVDELLAQSDISSDQQEYLLYLARDTEEIYRQTRDEVSRLDESLLREYGLTKDPKEKDRAYISSLVDDFMEKQTGDGCIGWGKSECRNDQKNWRWYRDLESLSPREKRAAVLARYIDFKKYFMDGRSVATACSRNKKSENLIHTFLNHRKIDNPVEQPLIELDGNLRPLDDFGLSNPYNIPKRRQLNEADARAIQELGSGAAIDPKRHLVAAAYGNPCDWDYRNKDKCSKWTYPPPKPPSTCRLTYPDSIIHTKFN